MGVCSSTPAAGSKYLLIYHGCFRKKKFIGRSSFIYQMREKLKIHRCLAFNPTVWSYQVATENSSPAPATAMGSRGTIADRMATTGQVLLTPPRMVGT